MPIEKPVANTRVIPDTTNVPKIPDNSLNFNINTINGTHKRLKIIKRTNNGILDLTIFFQVILSCAFFIKHTFKKSVMKLTRNNPYLHTI